MKNVKKDPKFCEVSIKRPKIGSPNKQLNLLEYICVTTANKCKFWAGSTLNKLRHTKINFSWLSQHVMLAFSIAHLITSEILLYYHGIWWNFCSLATLAKDFPGKKRKQSYHHVAIKKKYWVFTPLRGNHRRFYIKKADLKNFAIFTGKHLYWSLFLNKVAVQ